MVREAPTPIAPTLPTASGARRPEAWRSSMSAPRPPALRVPPTMDDAKYDDLIGRRVEVDRVRKTSHERTACLALNARVRERGLHDPGKRKVDFRGKGPAKPRALFLIPVTGVD